MILLVLNWIIFSYDAEFSLSWINGSSAVNKLFKGPIRIEIIIGLRAKTT